MKFKAEIEFQMEDREIEDTSDMEIADMLESSLERWADLAREEGAPVPIVFSVKVKGNIHTYTMAKDRT